MDEPETENILLEFPKYITTLYTLILNSVPRYTVGIYGEWGTGKTTLMKNVMSLLEAKGCNCMEFNAWRFAYEERHATYPLMLSIMSKILENKYVQQSLKKGKLQKIGSRIWQVVKGLKGSVTLKLPELAEVNLEIDPSAMTPENGKKIDFSELVEKTKPPLLEGIEVMKLMLEEVKGPNENSRLKLVIFIDDLDRCTPEKATEIFESVKVFFDIEGLVFVFGLSQTIIESAINFKYHHFEEKFNGKDYLKKIIQVPFTLPKWSEEDIGKFVLGLIEKNESPTYSEFFKNNRLLIAQGVESNPREVKILLNNFILSHQIHGKESNLDMKKLLSVQILSLTWRDFYDIVSIEPKFLRNFGSSKQDSEFNEKIKQSINSLGYIPSITATRPAVVKPRPELDSKDPIVETFKSNKKLMKFLKEEGKVIFDITDKEWGTYRRATSIEPDLKLLHELKSTPQKIESKAEIQPITFDDVELKDSIPFWVTGGTQSKGKIPQTLSRTFEFDISDSQPLIMQYNVPVELNIGGNKISHTSDIKLHIKLDGEEIAMTEWLGYHGRQELIPMETEIIKISGVQTGIHYLTLQPETKESYLDNWGGTLRIYELKETSKKPIQNVDELKETSKKPIQNESWLKENVYVPLYNELVKTYNDPNTFSTIPNDPWKDLQPIAKLRMEDEIKNILQKYSVALSDWRSTISNLNSTYILNQNQLGDIVKTAFDQVSLTLSNGYIQLSESSSQEPRHWLDAFKFIIFDDSITTPEILYEKLLEHTKLTANGHQQYIQKWKMEKPLLFTYIFNILPQLRTKLRVDSTNKEMVKQKTILKELEEQIINLLAEKIS
ncbi:MAG: hypothetical protein KGI19_06760 [Thaumarchaeota archaeon]|nr:hypothetical protein [Nitrososphaerota archaeon]